eukprot:368981_1
MKTSFTINNIAPKPPLPLPPINTIYDTSNHTNLTFPSLNYEEPRSNTPESDNNSILSTNTINTTNTIPLSPIINIPYTVPSSSPNTNTSDDDLYIPTKPIKKYKKYKKSKPKSNNNVLPNATGHCSIQWNEICDTKLECHICEKIYNDRTQYINCLKQHYNAENNDLVYLECELCLKNPTKKNLTKKEKLKLTSPNEPNKWRQSKHVANFISHLAGHSDVKPGFYCNVKVYNKHSNTYIKCNSAATTQQNLAKHIYNMHYKTNDKYNKYCVDPTFGYIEKKKLKLLQKKNKNKATKRKRKNTNKMIEFVVNDVIDLPKRKKRKLNIKQSKKQLWIRDSSGYEYKTHDEQLKFLKYLKFVTAPKLSMLADCVCGKSI